MILIGKKNQGKAAMIRLLYSKISKPLTNSDYKGRNNRQEPLFKTHVKRKLNKRRLKQQKKATHLRRMFVKTKPKTRTNRRTKIAPGQVRDTCQKNQCHVK